ncbi:Filamentation induced by cAMP protein Fic [Legionella steigerwaltii]|uniref:Filamentation induced by cAMP protein Fic n=1 Tax=Legionella steigerwaltii TaxID=460 RepID=A0A378LDS0_9GAMM|nr:Fic family protein [Legionella steigerwaltii]KTD70294.1 Filamentation induced by cAMP protein Fic [Legionella steigerwaltii]STY24028.1 Filamentation induced by cAMP protein Fic [Legionella steigerwaltii]
MQFIVEKQDITAEISILFREETLFTLNPMPALIWNKKLQQSLLQAEHYLNRLNTISKYFLTPSLLLKPFITNPSLTQKEEITDQHKIIVCPRGNLTDLSTLLRYHVAIEYSLELLSTNLISIELLQKIHKKMTQDDSNSQRFHPGEIRAKQVVLKNHKTGKIQYKPPSAKCLPYCLINHDLFLQDKTFSPVLHAAISHVQFISIHPFYDGNGRIGNLLIGLLLAQNKQFPEHFLSVVVFFIYSYFYSTVGAYSKAISQARKGYWYEWLIYFFDIISLVCCELVSRMEHIQQILKEYKIRASTHLKTIENKIINQLFNTPFFTAREMANELDVSLSRTYYAIHNLQDKNILTALYRSGRTIIYGSADIIQVLDKPVILNKQRMV